MFDTYPRVKRYFGAVGWTSEVVAGIIGDFAKFTLMAGTFKFGYCRAYGYWLREVVLKRWFPASGDWLLFEEIFPPHGIDTLISHFGHEGTFSQRHKILSRYRNCRLS
jgi:hypothetical protein